MGGARHAAGWLELRAGCAKSSRPSGRKAVSAISWSERGLGAGKFPFRAAAAAARLSDLGQTTSSPCTWMFMKKMIALGKPGSKVHTCLHEILTQSNKSAANSQG